jgi:hypothetical protein
MKFLMIIILVNAISLLATSSYATNTFVKNTPGIRKSESIKMAERNLQALCKQDKANAVRAQIPYQNCIRNKGNSLSAKAQCAAQKPIQPLCS